MPKARPTGAARAAGAGRLGARVPLADAPGNVRVAAHEAGLPRESVANASQVFTVDKALLTERTGQVRPATLDRIADGLRLVLEL